jgi:RimJ/RimL family protein N-acetyltransferase
VPFDYRPTLKGTLVELRPLRADDHARLYAVASDPLIWEQHPDKTRHQPGGFAAFLRESLASGGALLVSDSASGRVIGSSRFFGHDERGARSRSAGRSWPALTGAERTTAS